MASRDQAHPDRLYNEELRLRSLMRTTVRECLPATVRSALLQCVKLGLMGMTIAGPVFHRERNYASDVAMSQKCHFRSSINSTSW